MKATSQIIILEMMEPIIRKAQPGEEAAIHEAHMRSIREVCVKDHGEDEVRGWGNRPLGNRWVEAIKNGEVWVVEHNGKIHGHGCIKVFAEDGGVKARIHGLYLTPEVLGKGLGLRLANLMLENARNSRAKVVTLEATITAHEFYRRLGFLDVSGIERHEIAGHLVSCFPMMLKLSD